MSATGRKYDVVLFGASGFTGRQAARYFARHAPAGLRWAVAGRDREKLDALRVPADVLIADSGDQGAVDAVVSQTRVLLSTAGPFAKYGTPVVDACARFRTHYADITGEVFWAQQLAARYHDRAAAERVRIVPCCGFDSVPSDLGAFLLARHHRASVVRAYFQLGGGGLNGGTIASLTNTIAARRGRGLGRGDDFALPHRDDWIGTWVGPFFMAPVNRRVVARSAALMASWGNAYPAGFSYHEYWKFTAPLAATKAIAASVVMGMAGAVTRVPPLLHVAERLLPQPGQGPSESRMDRGWFSCDLVGCTAAGERVEAHIRNQGDAGNRSTVKMLCEAGLCLALGEATERGGVLTPATAFGDHLVSRLRAANMTVTSSSTGS
jgi:short subunit dehydrogenase-like uncharacterized protein